MSRPADPDRAERNRRIVEQQRRVAAIADRLADRLPPKSLHRIRTYDRAGENGLAFNLVLAVLSRHDIPVTRNEHHALVEAAGYYTKPSEYLTSITLEVLAALIIEDTPS